MRGGNYNGPLGPHFTGGGHYNNGYGGGGYSNNQPKKRSGAKETIQKKGKNTGKLAIVAWNYSRRRGLITLSAFENKKSKRIKSKVGNRFVTLIAEVVSRDTGEVSIHPIIYNVETGKAFVQRLNMVISTKAANGGYFGTIKRN